MFLLNRIKNHEAAESGGARKARAGCKDEDEEEEQLAFQICNGLEYLAERESVNLVALFNSLFATYYGENRDKSVEMGVERGYEGVRLVDEEADVECGFSDETFAALVASFQAGKCLHAKYALIVLERAIRLLATLPNVREVSLDEASGEQECVVCGDLHGHFDDLMSIVRNFGIPGKERFFVFNGDWCDRGSKQIECLLCIFYSFVLYPHKVLLNRGNHEDNAQNSLQMYSPCLKMAALSYFGKYGLVVYNKLDELFRHLPFATIVCNPPTGQRYFVVHGGINDSLDLERLQAFDRTRLTSLCRPSAALRSDKTYLKFLADVTDLLWSDPMSSPGLKPNANRNIGKLFGPDVTLRFLERHGFTKLIRSHECKPKGFELAHHNKLITVFSAANYILDNSGSVLKARHGHEKLEIFTFNSSKSGATAASAGQASKTRSAEEHTGASNLALAVRNLRLRLLKSKEKILAECRLADPTGSGRIRLGQLVSILAACVPNIPYMAIVERLCEVDAERRTAVYETLFLHDAAARPPRPSKYTDVPVAITDNIDLLISIFQMIDSDRNGFITPDEFQNVCNKIFRYLGVSFTQSDVRRFIDKIDTNRDGNIDIEEFKQAFTLEES